MPDLKYSADYVSPETRIRLFYTGQEGFGTTYRRFMLARLMWRFVDQHGFRTLAEVPCSGYETTKGESLVLGASSLAFAVKCCDVTFIDELEDNLNQVRNLWHDNGLLQKAKFITAPPTSVPVEDDTYDLVWNDLATPLLLEPELYLREMQRISKFVLLVCENRDNYGYPIYVMKNFLARTEGIYGASKWLNRGNVKRALVSLGMKVVEEGLIDVPPWPGFTALADLLVHFHRPRVGVGGGVIEDFSSISKVVRRYSFIEESGLPTMIKSKFAHSFYVLAEKR